MRRADARIALLLEVLDQSYGARGWQGTTLLGALRGLTPAQALWRVGPGRPRIWDYVLHCAYWKYAVRRRLAGEAAGSFGRSPANWPAVPPRPTAAAWRADVRFLDAQHRALRALVAAMPPAGLDARSSKKTWRNIEQIHGVAAHDVYHTGQIQLVKRLMPPRLRSRS